jgi:dCMP deaminase
MKMIKMMTDKEYMLEAKNAALKSRCIKRPLGCVLVFEDGSYIEGTNGAPKPLKACNPCPRMIKGSHSGQDMDLCRAVHAERQVLLKAAKFGYATEGAKLYSYMGVPCKDCYIELIEAGISEIICINETYYDELSKKILKEWRENGGIFRVLNMS